ncbi:MAG TPA: hypothetical protein PKL97_02400 [Candidatus Omnitrophota bacterium]|nr:hypothetical protein [Candidatus Omnitrophota bacterium]
MGRILSRLLLWTALAGLAAWAAGVRFHPDVLLRALKGEEKEYRKVELTSGAVFTGEILSQTGDSIQIKLPEGMMTFSKREIKNIAKATAQEIDASGKALKSYGRTREPLVSYHPEKNIFIGNARKSPGPALSQKPLTALSPGNTLTSVDSSALAAAQAAKAAAERQRRKIENQIREMEAGY